MVDQNDVKEIAVEELKELIDNGADFQLIDVREPWEYEHANIQGELIPMNIVGEKVEQISKDKQVVIMCRSGKRSANVVRYLQKNFDLGNLFNLSGGILEWADKIDQRLEKY